MDIDRFNEHECSQPAMLSKGVVGEVVSLQECIQASANEEIGEVESAVRRPEKKSFMFSRSGVINPAS